MAAILSSNKKDWTALCAEAAVGGLSALAVVPHGQLAGDPPLRRLLLAIAAEAAAVARQGGLRVSGRPEAQALRICRRSPRRCHPWMTALRAGRSTGAAAVFAPLLDCARRAGRPAPTLSIIAKVLGRLEPRRRK